MKRILLCLVFVLFVVGVLWFAFSRQDRSAVTAAHLAPANSIFFVECRDFGETEKRWPHTSLAAILAEPSVKQFFNYSANNLPGPSKVVEQALQKLSPSSIFFSSYALNREEWIFGIHCSGDLRSWEAQFAVPLASLFNSRFRALSESAKNDFATVQPKKGLFFGVRTGSWLLFSPRPRYLEDALRRTGAVNSGLDTSEVFLHCQARVPTDADFYAFAAGEGLKFIRARVEPFLPPEEVSGLIFTTKLDGELVHDTLFAYSPHPQAPEDFDRKGMLLSTENTLLYASTTLDLLKLRVAADALSSQWGIAETAKQYLDEVTHAGVDFRELSGLVKGVELILNRNPSNDSIGGAFLVETRNSARASEILKMILQEEFPKKYEETMLGGGTVYEFRNKSSTSLVLGMVGQDLVATTGEDSFEAAAKGILGGKVGLRAPAGFDGSGPGQAMDNLRFYIDTKTVFERSYATLRPILIFGSAFIPDLDRYVDATILPDAGEISRHLSPIALTRREVSDGMLDESIGSLTAYEVSLLGAAGTIGFTMFQNQN